MLKSEKTRRIILQKAKELFYAQGYNQCSIAQIQSSSQNSSIHYYYKSKKDISTKIFYEYLLNLNREITKNDLFLEDENLLLFSVMYIALHHFFIEDSANSRYILETLFECKDGYMEMIELIFLGAFKNISLKNGQVLQIDSCTFNILIILYSIEVTFSKFVDDNTFQLEESIMKIIYFSGKIFDLPKKSIEEKIQKMQKILNIEDFHSIKLLN